MATRSLRTAVFSVISGLLAITGTGLYLTQFSDSGKLSIVDQFEPVPDVDSHLTGITGLKYREDGAIAYRWRAETAERLIHNGTIVLSEPYYIGNIGDQRPWTAEAEQGRLLPDGQNLQLQRDVVVRDLIREAQIDTAVLHIDLESSRVHTESALSLTFKNGQTESLGMRASLSDERVELLDQVRGHYDPQ